jgi:hypothetical protein
MINKGCPLSDRDKFYVTMHGDCKYSAEHFGEKECCAKCPYSLKFKIPAVRRAIPKLIANDIFNVQPMAGPVGTIFKMKWVYKGKKNVRKKMSAK